MPPRAAIAAILEAAEAGITFVVCITEFIPAHDEARCYNRLVEDFPGMRLLGPNCPGIISPGRCNIGITSGDIALPGGPVGIVSRSGTLTYQALHELSAKGVGQTTCVGIGGDPVPGTNFIDCLAAFQEDDETKAVMMIGEIGGSEEERAAAWIKANMTKPVVAYIAGVTAPPGRKMGHAGAIISGSQGTAQAKMDALRDAGVTVARNPTEAGDRMVDVVRGLRRRRWRWPSLPRGRGRSSRRSPPPRPVDVCAVDRPCRALDVAARAGVEALMVAREDHGGFTAAFDREAYTAPCSTSSSPATSTSCAWPASGRSSPRRSSTRSRAACSTRTPRCSLRTAAGTPCATRSRTARRPRAARSTWRPTALDDGPILAQEAVEVRADDDEASLHARIKAAEQRLYPEVIQRVRDALAAGGSPASLARPAGVGGR